MTSQQMVEYSFVILTYNSERYISECLRSLECALGGLESRVEVFIIDNGSHDNTRSMIDVFHFSENIHLELIAYPYNTGTTYSRNQGFQRATGKYIVVMDSDAYMNAESLTGLAGYLSEHASCGMAVPLLTYPDGRFQLSTDQFPTLLRKIQRFFFLKAIERDAVLDRAVQTVDYAISACWVIPKHVLDKVGMLDEKIFYAPEDVDYCIRIWKKGYEICYLPMFSIIHDAQEISRAKGLSINWFTLSHIKGLIYLYWKHKFLFSGRRIRRQFERFSQSLAGEDSLP